MRADKMNSHISLARSAGFSLIELMISLTIGLILLTVLSLILVNSHESNRELAKTAQQIENGRYAIDVMSQNIRHAGFYGHLFSLPIAPGSLPDPCETANLTTLRDALALPIQGYRAADLATRADLSSTSCISKNLLTNDNLKPGSDIIVVRRASTQALPIGTVPILGDAYIISTGRSVDVQPGTTTAITAASQVDGTTACVTGSAVATAGLCRQNGSAPPIRKYIVHIYFVAPCSTGSGTNGMCTSGDDTIPTLKRLELVAAGGTRKFEIVPLVEGIDYLKAEYGVDSSPSAVSISTGLIGDGIVDAYTALPATAAEWSTVIAAKIFVLARNTETTNAYSDSKTYALGSISPVLMTSAANDAYKRHAYSTNVRLVNPSGRREIP
jgi:type IV pilus assembly protein PilW